MSIRSLTNPASGDAYQNLFANNITYTGNLSPNPQLFKSVGPPGSNAQYKGTDQTPFNLAIIDIYNAGGGTLVILSGTYVITNPIYLLPTVNLLGQSRSDVILQANGCVSILQGIVNPYVNNISIRNLTLRGNATHSLLHFIGDAVTMQNLIVDGTNDGVSFCPTGIYMDDAGSPLQFNSILACSFSNNITQHIYVSAANWNALVNGCLINNGTVNAIGVNAVGFSTQLTNNYFIFCSTAITCGLTLLSINNVFAGCGKCVVINTTTPPIPLEMSFLSTGSFVSNFGSTNSFLECTVNTGHSYTVVINALFTTGAYLNPAPIQFYGQGTKKYQITLNNLTNVSDDGTGIITSDSYVTEPLIPQTSPPNAIFGVTYLNDNGAGVLTQQRYDGVAWVNF